MPSLSVFLRLLTATLLSSLLVGSLNSTLAQSVSRDLDPEASLSGQLKREEVHSYRIALSTEQFLHLEIKSPLGLRVIFKLLGPDGQAAAKVDLRQSPFQTEHLFFVAQNAGEYRLEFSGAAIQIKPYQIEISALREATENDRARYAAQQLYTEAASLVNATVEERREATRKLPELLRVLRDLGDRRGEAEAAYLGGLLHSQLDKLNKALDYFARTLPLARELGDRRAEAATLTSMSDLYIGLGEPQKAAEHGEQALPLWRGLGDTEGEALVLHNSSAQYRNVGEWQQAFSYQQRALELWRGSGSAEAFARLGMGNLYRVIGEPEKASEYYSQALAIWEGLDSDYRFMRAVVHNYIGLTRNALGEQQKALEHIKRGLELSRAGDDSYLEGSSLINLGLVYENSGELQKALLHYSQALPKIRATERRSKQSEALQSIGRIHLSLGDLKKADENFKEALSLRRYINDQGGEAETLSGLARVEQAWGNLSGARAHVESAIKLIESLRAKIINPELRASFFAQSQASYKLYIDLLMQLHKREPGAGHAAAAFLASERARARSLLETLNESRIELREGIEPSLMARELALQQRLKSKTERLAHILNGAHTAVEAGAARKELENVLSEFQGVQDDVRARSPRYAALMQPKQLTLKEIQTEVLDPDTVLLEYSLGEDRSYLWAVTPFSVNAYELPGRFEIEVAARRVYELLTARNKNVKGETAEQRLLRSRANDRQFAEAAERLSKMILHPVLPHLTTKRLVVVSEGALQYIPFAALPKPPHEGYAAHGAARKSGNMDSTPLVASHEIVTLPSASTMALLRQERESSKPPTKTLAVFADPVFEIDDVRVKRHMTGTRNGDLASGSAVGSARSSEIKRSAWESGVEKLGRLYFSSREAETISSFAPEDQRLKAVGFLANKATATSPDLSAYRLLHFATHGLINTRHPELSGIILSLVDDRGQPVDGFLRLHEIYNLRLHADLVVLSACQTALGKEIKGEGFIGLTRGFMYAGTPRVVASLWRVDDRATAELMSLFYRAMLEGKLTVAAALRAAQVEMAKRRAAPYYWAGFTLQGEWR